MVLATLRSFIDMRLTSGFIMIGCLIVELHNYRPAKAKDPIPTQPSRERVILRPTPETIWQDICLMNAKTGSQWVDTDALELEAKILVCVVYFTIYICYND